MRTLMGMMLIGMLLGGVSYGAYLDAEGGEGGNTVRASDGNASAWWTTATAPDGLWGRRAFGYDQGGVFNGATKDIFEASGTGSGVEDGVPVVTTISGLIPGVLYSVEVVYWSSESQNWSVRAGFEAGSMILFDRLADAASGATAGTLIEGTHDGDRDAYTGLLGYTTADVNGEIKVYIDDKPAVGPTEGWYDRSWYDGLLYEEYNLAGNPSPSDGATDVPLTTPVLSFTPRVDPNNPTQEDPAIISHRVYFDDDPNLADAGDLIATLPRGTNQVSMPALSNDKTYYWRVDEVLGGGTVTGFVWTFSTPVSVPVITQQPSDVRVFTTDPAAEFTVQFASASPVTATWYKDGAALADGGNVSIGTDPYAASTLTIAAPTETDEGTYYCVLDNQPGTADDQQTASRLLIIKKTLAAFDFEQNLDDSSGNNAPAGIVKTVALADPNERLATVVASPAYDPDGIEGYAITLDGTQFIDLGIEGYPKAGPLDTIGDIRGGGYEKQGFGRGMDAGSILCWVKPASDGAVYANANIADGTHFGVTTNGTDSARIIVRGENWDGGWQNLGEASGAHQREGFSLQDGRWHQFAATWNDSTARIYIDGELVATNSQGFTEVYRPWDLGNLIGASRQGQPNRHLLNAADFLTGAVDRLRVYNYALPYEEIAQEYMTLSGMTPCENHAFTGSAFNFDDTGSSYCRVDLYDLAEFAKAWLNSGLFLSSAN